MKPFAAVGGQQVETRAGRSRPSLVAHTGGVDAFAAEATIHCSVASVHTTPQQACDCHAQLEHLQVGYFAVVLSRRQEAGGAAAATEARLAFAWRTDVSTEDSLLHWHAPTLRPTLAMLCEEHLAQRANGHY